MVAGIRTPIPCEQMGEVEQEELAGTAGGQEDARSPLQGRAGFRVHDRKGQAVHAANPQRQAHHRRRGEDCRRYGEGKADRREDGCAARRSGHRSISFCTRRSIPRPRRMCIAKGLPASPGAAVGKIAFTAEEAENARCRRREDHPRPSRNRAGRHRRHARLRRHSHQHRRHDQPRGGRGPRHGHALRGRRRRSCTSTPRPRRSPSTARRYGIERLSSASTARPAKYGRRRSTP